MQWITNCTMPLPLWGNARAAAHSARGRPPQRVCRRCPQCAPAMGGTDATCSMPRSHAAERIHGKSMAASLKLLSMPLPGFSSLASVLQVWSAVAPAAAAPAVLEPSQQ